MRWIPLAPAYVTTIFKTVQGMELYTVRLSTSGCFNGRVMDSYYSGDVSLADESYPA